MAGVLREADGYLRERVTTNRVNRIATLQMSTVGKEVKEPKEIRGAVQRQEKPRSRGRVAKSCLKGTGMDLLR